jgi:hypothetical protein
MGKAENQLGVDDTWGTSAELLEGIAPLGPIGLDPCSHPKSLVRSREAILLPTYLYARDDASKLRVPLMRLADEVAPRPQHAERVIYGDGLRERWDGRGLLYINEPFSELGLWLDKAAREGDQVCMLAPIRSGNKEWAPANTADVRCDLPRQTFNGADVHAPFHLCLLWWGPVDLGYDVFSKLGHTTRHERHTQSRQRLIARGHALVGEPAPRFRLG